MSFVFPEGSMTHELGILGIPLAGEPVAPVLVGMVAEHERNRHRLAFFNDGGNFDPTVVRIGSRGYEKNKNTTDR